MKCLSSSGTSLESSTKTTQLKYGDPLSDGQVERSVALSNGSLQGAFQSDLKKEELKN